MEHVPATASEHPATWKFDFPVYHPADLAAWRAWLHAYHGSVRGVWVASWRSASGRARVAYDDLVEEAICFGWIDSTVNTLDEERRLQMMTPRRPKSAWDGFPPSARKQMLWWVISAGKAETRARRIAEIVAQAGQGRRAAG